MHGARPEPVPARGHPGAARGRRRGTAPRRGEVRSGGHRAEILARLGRVERGAGELPVGELDARYVEGLQVSLSFVEQRFKAARALRHGLHEANHVLEIKVEESRLRSSRYAPGPFLTDAPWKTAEYIDAVRVRLLAASADLRPGLSDDEVGAIESEFGFQFPSDLRFLLQTILPVSNRFPDWRSPDRARLRERLDWPADGICFDIEHNSFWLEDWGVREAPLFRWRAARTIRLARGVASKTLTGG